MSISPTQKRSAANLLNAMDILWRRSLPKLGEPFGMNAAQIGQFRERMFMLADELRRVQDLAAQVLANPADLLGWMPPDADALDYAAYEFPIEEERALIEEEKRKLEAEAARIAEAERILREKGLIAAKTEAPVSESAPHSREDGDPGAHADAAPMQEAAVEPPANIAPDDAQASAPTGTPPSLEERRAAYQAAHAALIASLKQSCETLTAWVRADDSAKFL